MWEVYSPSRRSNAPRSVEPVPSASYSAKMRGLVLGGERSPPSVGRPGRSATAIIMGARRSGMQSSWSLFYVVLSRPVGMLAYSGCLTSA